MSGQRPGERRLSGGGVGVGQASRDIRAKSKNGSKGSRPHHTGLCQAFTCRKLRAHASMAMSCQSKQRNAAACYHHLVSQSRDCTVLKTCVSSLHSTSGHHHTSAAAAACSLALR